MVRTWVEVDWNESSRIPLKKWRKVSEKLAYVKNKRGNACGEIITAYIAFIEGRVYGRVTIRNTYGYILSDKIKLVFIDDVERVIKEIKCRNRKTCIEALNELIEKEEETFKKELDYCP